MIHSLSFSLIPTIIRFIEKRPKTPKLHACVAAVSSRNHSYNMLAPGDYLSPVLKCNGTGEPEEPQGQNSEPDDLSEFDEILESWNQEIQSSEHSIPAYIMDEVIDLFSSSNRKKPDTAAALNTDELPPINIEGPKPDNIELN